MLRTELHIVREVECAVKGDRTVINCLPKTESMSASHPSRDLPVHCVTIDRSVGRQAAEHKAGRPFLSKGRNIRCHSLKLVIRVNERACSRPNHDLRD